MFEFLVYLLLGVTSRPSSDAAILDVTTTMVSTKSAEWLSIFGNMKIIVG